LSHNRDDIGDRRDLNGDLNLNLRDVSGGSGSTASLPSHRCGSLHLPPQVPDETDDREVNGDLQAPEQHTTGHHGKDQGHHRSQQQTEKGTTTARRGGDLTSLTALTVHSTLRPGAHHPDESRPEEPHHAHQRAQNPSGEDEYRPDQPNRQ
jgi:hypothetical protein